MKPIKKSRHKCLQQKRKNVVIFTKKTIVCNLKRKKKKEKCKTIRKKGPRGHRGKQGYTGSQGPPGPQGEQGPPGPLPDVTIRPTVDRFFYIPISDLILSALVSIPANLFTNDNGKSIISFPSMGINSYDNLFINGILQESGAYDVNPNALNFHPQNNIIYAGSPIILNVMQFITLVS